MYKLITILIDNEPMPCPATHPYALEKGKCCCKESAVLANIPNPSVTTPCTECNADLMHADIQNCTLLGSEYCVNAGM